MSDYKPPVRHTKHVYRVVIILCVAVVIVFLVRYLLIPDGWGEFGFFRSGAVSDALEVPLVHGGSVSCEPCHGDQHGEVMAHEHATVACESCHMPLATHVQDGKKIAKMPTDRTYKLCARCHRKVQGRPLGFPQVNVEEHLASQGGTLGPEVCLDCHSPHSPLEGLR